MQAGGLIFAGFDIETTGSDIYKGHAICQVGLYTPKHEFVSDVGVAVGTPVTQQALEVNGFSMERLTEGPSLAQVDNHLHEKLVGMTAGMGLVIPVGWNVAGFDMGFMRRWMPVSYADFSYRTVDLNAVCFTLDPVRWERFKRAANQYAKQKLQGLGWAERWHDALYDAAASYYAWEYLRDVVIVEIRD